MGMNWVQPTTHARHLREVVVVVVVVVSLSMVSIAKRCVDECHITQYVSQSRRRVQCVLCNRIGSWLRKVAQSYIA